MKRILCLILSVVFLFCLCACNSSSENFRNPVSFYYLQVQQPDHIYHGSADSVIAEEIREGYGITDNMTALLGQFLAGPMTDQYRSPFPSGTRLVAWGMDGNTLSVTLSDHAAELSGIDLTLACACLAKTCLGLGDFDAVRIQTYTQTLDGKFSVTMNESTLLLLDDTIAGEETDSK